jgi:hypothetical protein
MRLQTHELTAKHWARTVKHRPWGHELQVCDIGIRRVCMVTSDDDGVVDDASSKLRSRSVCVIVQVCIVEASRDVGEKRPRRNKRRAEMAREEQEERHEIVQSWLRIQIVWFMVEH